MLKKGVCFLLQEAGMRWASCSCWKWCWPSSLEKRGGAIGQRTRWDYRWSCLSIGSPFVKLSLVFVCDNLHQPQLHQPQLHQPHFCPGWINHAALSLSGCPTCVFSSFPQIAQCLAFFSGNYTSIKDDDRHLVFKSSFGQISETKRFPQRWKRVTEHYFKKKLTNLQECALFLWKKIRFDQKPKKFPKFFENFGNFFGMTWKFWNIF